MKNIIRQKIQPIHLSPKDSISLMVRWKEILTRKVNRPLVVNQVVIFDTEGEFNEKDGIGGAFLEVE